MRQTSGDSGALQSLSLGLAVVLRSEVSSVLPDEQFRCKAQSAPLGCPTLPAQVAFIVSPGNFLWCLESPGSWERSPVLSRSWCCRKTKSVLSHRLLDHKPGTRVPQQSPVTFLVPELPHTFHPDHAQLTQVPRAPFLGGKSSASLTSWMLSYYYLLFLQNPSLSRGLGQMPKVNMPKPEQVTALLRPLPATKARVQPLRGLHWSLPIGAICDLLQATPNTLPPTLPYGPLLSPGDTQS